MNVVELFVNEELFDIVLDIIIDDDNNYVESFDSFIFEVGS